LLAWVSSGFSALSQVFGCSVASLFGIGAGAGQAIGAWIGGLLHDWTGGYDAVIRFSVISLFARHGAVLTLRALLK
jgi:hypothetical protein